MMVLPCFERDYENKFPIVGDFGFMALSDIFNASSLGILLVGECKLNYGNSNEDHLMDSTKFLPQVYRFFVRG